MGREDETEISSVGPEGDLGACRSQGKARCSLKGCKGPVYGATESSVAVLLERDLGARGKASRRRERRGIRRSIRGSSVFRGMQRHHRPTESSWAHTKAPRPARWFSGSRDQAARRTLTTGRCRRPAWYWTSTASRAPGCPRTSACGRAHGAGRGHGGPRIWWTRR